MSRHRTRTCRGKRRFRDQQEARRSMRHVAATSSRERVPVRPYYCAGCNGWHLTSREDRNA